MQDQAIRFIDKPFMALTKNADGIERIVGHYARQSVAASEASRIEGGFIAFNTYVPNSAQLEDLVPETP